MRVQNHSKCKHPILAGYDDRFAKGKGQDMRIRTIVATFAVALGAAGASAQQPTPEEAMARCVADITEKSKAMGQDESRATEICQCLVPKVGEQPELIAEIEAAGGLPGPDAASEALGEVVDSCLPSE